MAENHIHADSQTVTTLRDNQSIEEMRPAGRPGVTLSGAWN
jgi:hypothetical protein